jgi:peptidoglycan/LPS O-acetylase OafA/YrhL
MGRSIGDPGIGNQFPEDDCVLSGADVLTGKSATTSGQVVSSQKQTMVSLQVLRGLAAAFVAIYHTHLILAQPEYGSHDLFGEVAGKGWLGVNLFFVLSGFIITFAHIRDLGKPSRLKSYVWKRFVRVYPVYWIFLTAYICAAIIGLGHADFEYDAGNLFSSYVLIKFVEPLTLPLKVAWTLFYEVTFYAVFALFIINVRLGICVGVAWIAGIAINTMFIGNHDLGPFHMWNAYFMAGCLCYFAYQHMDPRWGGWLLTAGVAMLGVMGTTAVSNRISDAQQNPGMLLMLIVPFICIIVGILQLERQNLVFAPRFLKFLGDASYSVYLVHSPVISLIAIINYKLAPAFIAPTVLFVGTCVISVLAGVIAHLVVEKPLLELLRGRHPFKRTRLSQMATSHSEGG